MSRSEPRIPIEIETRPIRHESPRLGCSAIALTALVAAVAFYFLITQVTPKWVNSGAALVGSIFNAASPTPAVALATDTPEATATPEATPTPADSVLQASYVQVANTDGVGVKLRKDAHQNATRVRTLPEGTVVQVIGPDQTNDEGTWANVRTLDENGDIGWISRKYLAPANGPLLE